MIARSLALVAGLVVAIGVATAPMAHAHAYLTGANPAPGATVRGHAQPLVLHFTEAVDPTASSVTIVAGARRIPVVPLAHAANDPLTLQGVVPAGVPDGAVSVAWKSVSTDDGHVLTGSYDLHVATPPATTGAAASTGAATNTAGVSGLFSLMRMLSYLAMAMLCGGLAFLIMLWPAGADVARARHVLWASLGVGVVATGLGIALQGVSVAQTGLSSLFSLSQLGDTLASRVGTVWAVRGLLYLLMVPVLVQLGRGGSRIVRSAPWLVSTSAIGIALLRTPGLVDHTAETHWAWLGSVADLVHLIGVALWIGGLGFLCLVVLPRRRVEELRVVIPRFSALAFVSVAGVIVAGTFMSWQLIGGVHPLFSTAFGHLVLIKVGVFTVAIVAAQLSRIWVEDRLALAAVIGDAETVRPFVYSVAAEAVLAVGLLAVASVLVNTSPPH